MSLPVSVIIPTLNEEAWIGRAVESAFAAGAAEVIVCDGGSTDATTSLAASLGARILQCERKRARQLNRGAEAAQSPTLLFLHADTLLPENALAVVLNTLSSGIAFGGFRLRFAERSLRLRWVAAMVNLRTTVTRCPWGDQAQFIRREEFFASGGYADLPLMEDYELARRMKRRGPVAILRLEVTTSGRRFLKRGVLRTAWTNWRIIAAWHLGRDPEQLARMYRR